MNTCSLLSSKVASSENEDVVIFDLTFLFIISIIKHEQESIIN